MEEDFCCPYCDELVAESEKIWSEALEDDCCMDCWSRAKDGELKK